VVFGAASVTSFSSDLTLDIEAYFGTGSGGGGTKRLADVGATTTGLPDFGTGSRGTKGLVGKGSGEGSSVAGSGEGAALLFAVLFPPLGGRNLRNGSIWLILLKQPTSKLGLGTGSVGNPGLGVAAIPLIMP